MKKSLLVILDVVLTLVLNGQTLSIDKIFSKAWKVEDAPATRLELDGNYSFSSYKILEDRNEVAFLSSTASEILIYNLTSGNRVSVISLPPVANDFAYYSNSFYALYDRAINVYNDMGTLVDVINLPKYFDFVQDLKVVDGYIYLLTSDEKTYRITNNNFEEVSNSWLFGNTGEVKVTINRNENSFLIEGKTPAEKFTGSVVLNESIASVSPVGIIGNNAFLHYEKFISQSPLQVESRLLVYSIANNAVVSNLKLPNISYSFIHNAFEFINGNLYHIVTSPTEIQIFKLGFASTGSDYPNELLNDFYHYNEHLPQGIPTSDEQQPAQGGPRGGSPCSITQTQVETNALAYRDLVWSCTANSLRSPCTDRCLLGCRAAVGSKKVVTPPYITGIGSFTGVPYKWGGYTALSNFNSYANQGRYVGNWLTTAMSSGNPNCPTAPDAHLNDSDNDVIGVDCSGFVSRVWGISHQTTDYLDNFCTNIPITASQMELGDIWLKQGSHVMLFLSGNPTGTQNIIEATVGGSAKVRTTTYTYNANNGYYPYRYDNICISGGSTPTLNCSNYIQLNCGIIYNGSSSSATSNITTYGCNSWTETGPERVHRITTTSTGNLTATISNFTGDLDVYILGSCDPSDCLGTVSSSSSTYNNAPAGTYYIIVDADDGSGSSYSLLVTCSSNTPTQPDLSVSNTSLSLGPFCAGNSVTALSTVNNTGTSTAGASTMRYYLSTNTTYDGSDVLLGSSNVSSVSAGSSSSQIVASFTIPGGTAAGSYYILYYTDAPTGIISETNENNNVAYRSISISNCTSSSPDLVVTNPDFSTYSLCAGSNITASCEIENIGGTSASASAIKYYLSSNNTYSGNDVLLGTASIITLSTGSSTSRTTALNIPTGTAMGTWYILVITDADNVVAEGVSGEGNNLFAGQITITNCSGLADIVVNYVGTPPTSTIPGVDVSVDLECENIGSITTTQTKVGFYLSPDNIWDVSDELIDDIGTNSLDPNEIDDDHIGVDIPNCIPCGSYYIIMKADYEEIVSESNESNNYYSFPLTVVGCPACTYTVPANGINFQSSGGTGNLTITTGNCCEWDAITADNWITVINGHDFGNGVVNYTVSPCNGGGTRTGTITVGGQTHTITQNCTQSCNASQSFEWAAQAGSTTLSDASEDLAIDGSGNLYMTGDIQGAATFGGGITLTTPSSPPDVFVSKHNSLGTIQWAVRFGNSDNDKGHAIAIDNSGNIYVVGHFENSVTFGSTTLTSNNTDEYAAFILKLNSTGVVQWAKKINSTFYGVATDIVIDNSNNIYVTGDISDYQGSAGDGFFVAKYNTSGTQQYYSTYGMGTGIRNIWGIATDNSGNTFVVGRYDGSITLGAYTLTPLSIFSFEAFIVKINSAGTVLWAKKASGAGNGSAEYKSIALDGNNDIYVIGTVDSSATIGNLNIPLTNTTKFILVKYDQTGNPVWAKASTDGSQPNGFRIVKGFDADMYVCGQFQTSMTIDSITLTTAGSGDGFILRIDTTGLTKWLIRYGGIESESAEGIVTNSTNDVFVSGGLRGTVAFGSSTITSTGSEDIYLAKFKQCDPPTAPITYSGSLSICPGQSVNLSSSYCATNSYQWLLNNLNIDGATNPTYAATQAGSYKIRVSAFAGCETTSSVVIVNDGNITFPNIAGNTSVCDNQTTQLNAGSGYSSYSWSNGGNQQNIDVQAGNYIVTVTNSAGCSATDQVTVVGGSTPVTPTISGANSGCDSVVLSSGSSGCSGCSYSWNNGDNDNTVIFHSSTNYTVTATNTCGSATASGNVVVNYTPSANISYTNNGNTYNFSSNAQGNPTTYSWNFGDGSTETSANPSHTYSQTGSVTISLTVTNNCGLNTYQRTININPNCTYSVSQNTVVADSNGTSQVINVTCGSACVWNVNIGNCSWLSVAPLADTGTHTFTVTIPATIDTFVKQCTVTVEGKAIAITQYGKQGSVSCASVDTLVQVNGGCDLAAAAVPNATYQWYKSGQQIPNATSQYYTATQNGYYHVQIAVGNCTYQSSDHYLTCFTGIEESSISNLKVYPNPTDGTFVINGEARNAMELSVNLYNTLGQLVYVRDISLKGTTINEEIRVEGLSTGIYQLQLLIDKQYSNLKLLLK